MVAKRVILRHTKGTAPGLRQIVGFAEGKELPTKTDEFTILCPGGERKTTATLTHTAKHYVVYTEN
jgi:hypothetical protein